MTIFILIFLLLLLIYSFVIEYYRRAWHALTWAKTTGSATTKISVVIAARNEESTLPALLECLSRQHYPSELFEVVIVDDHSTDHTWQVLSSYGPRFRLLRWQLPEGVTGKKRAIEYAVARASGNLIVQTDADCTMHPGWLSSYAQLYEQKEAKFIAAPVVIRANDTFLGVFQALDFLTLQTITGASVSKRFHMMCNGANMAFDREAFEEVTGFEGIDHIPSGDDMLLMQKIFKKFPDKVFYLKDEAAMVNTSPVGSWKEFFNQRIRWSSKAVHYKDKKIFFVLLVTYLVNVCYLALAVAAMVSSYWFPFLLLLLLAKILIEYPLVNAGALFFGQQRLMKWFAFLQPAHILYVIIAGWLGRFGSYEWKSRIVKNNGPGKLAKQ